MVRGPQGRGKGAVSDGKWGRARQKPHPHPPYWIYLFLLYVFGCFACMYICAFCVCRVPVELEEGSCEQSYGCWEPNPGHL